MDTDAFIVESFDKSPIGASLPADESPTIAGEEQDARSCDEGSEEGTPKKSSKYWHRKKEIGGIEKVGEMLDLANVTISKLQSSAEETGRAISQKLRGKSPLHENQHPALYKTALCKRFRDSHSCSYGKECWFAHGVEELREHPSPAVRAKSTSSPSAATSPPTRYLATKKADAAMKVSRWRS